MIPLTQAQIKRRHAIIKDIIQKRPTLNGCTYEEESFFDYDRNYQRKRMIPNKPFFGYDPEELYTLRLHDDSYSLKSDISELYDKALKQKQNRFSERISQPLHDFLRKVGIPGLYRVHTTTSSLGFVYAKNLEEARRTADVTYGFVVAGKTTRYGDPIELTVRFNRQGTVADLNQVNHSDVERIDRKIADAKETIEQLKAQITEYETERVAIQMAEMSQLSSSFEDDGEVMNEDAA